MLSNVKAQPMAALADIRCRYLFGQAQQLPALETKVQGTVYAKHYYFLTTGIYSLKINPFIGNTLGAPLVGQ